MEDVEELVFLSASGLKAFPPITHGLAGETGKLLAYVARFRQKIVHLILGTFDGLCASNGLSHAFHYKVLSDISLSRYFLFQK